MLGAHELDHAIAKGVAQPLAVPLDDGRVGHLAPLVADGLPDLSICGLPGSAAQALPCEVQTGMSRIKRPIGSRTVAKPTSVPLTNGVQLMSCRRSPVMTGLGGGR
jgi:hypothetical protein